MSPDPAVTRRLPSSFRDPSGYVFERDGVLLRQVTQSFAAGFDAYRESGLHEALLAEGLTVPFEEVSLALAADPSTAHAVLKPERVPFVSYAYEWSPSQLRAAALATLRMQDLALDHGMTLRDASAYNIQFRRGQPVHIDTLSFAPYVEGEPWTAYRQFCQHFLAPLALQTSVDVRLSKLLTTNIDGVPLDLASALLPTSSKFRPALMLHVHGQASSSQRSAGAGRQRHASFSLRAMRGLVDGLRGAVRKMCWEPRGTTWVDYYEEADHYTDTAMQAKAEKVAEWLDASHPSQVWDLGANTGRFARLAAARGAHVVAFDIDAGAVERAWTDPSIHCTNGEVLPLILDLSVPSPSIGWANAERMSLAERGPVDLVMALALVHHLAIGNGVPLWRVAEYFSLLGRRLIVEWVPREDPKVQMLLSTRSDPFDGYNHQVFEQAFMKYFAVLDQAQVPDTGRVLYLMDVR
jgi:SAM-dependent methyltransferase